MGWGWSRPNRKAESRGGEGGELEGRTALREGGSVCKKMFGGLGVGLDLGPSLTRVE